MAEIDHVQHVGSLIRPAALGEAMKPYRAGWTRNKFDTEEQEKQAHAVVENCIRDVVQEQLQRGIRPITSGEFERVAYWNGLLEHLDGLEMRLIPFKGGIWRPGNTLNIFCEAVGEPSREAWVATGKIRRTKAVYLDEWLFLRSCLPQDMWKHAKITVLSPLWWHQLLLEPYTPESGYDSSRAYLSDVVAALREEILELYEHGLRQVQVDDPILTWMHSREMTPFIQQEGTDMNELMDLYMWALKQLTQEWPDDLILSHHMCRGNAPGDPMPITGDYEAVAARLFVETDFKQFYLEHIVQEKHGNFSFLRHLQRNQVVVIGLISTKFAELEDLSTLKARVLDAAQVIAHAQQRALEDVLRDNIAVSPQCGFASAMDFSAMDIERQWDKLKLLQTLVSEVWPAAR